MTVATFDTCAAAKRLRDAGFDESQAEAAVAMVRDAFTEGVATKADIRSAVSDLRAGLRELRAEFRTALAFVAALLIALLGRSFGAF